jgi:ribosomal protein L40E
MAGNDLHPRLIMDCTQCGHKLQGDARFCTECGSFQGDVASCLQCWHRLPDNAKFCSECGSSQDEAVTKAKSLCQGPTLTVDNGRN